MEKTLQQRAAQFEKEYLTYLKKEKQITAARFVIFIAAAYLLYASFKFDNYWLLVPTVILIILFFVLLKFDTIVISKKNKAKTLQTINEKEIVFLQTNKIDTNNGLQFVTPKHLYTNDLDVFGNSSLYQFLNRTATVMGQQQLANALQTAQQQEQIEANQAAVKELATKLAFRQNVYAYAQLSDDNVKKYQQILDWTNTESKPLHKFIRVLMVIMPLVLITCIILYNVTNIPNMGWASTFVFIFNTFIFSLYSKVLLHIIGSNSNIHNTLKQYATIIRHIETEALTAPRLLQLQSQLKTTNIEASKALAKLSTIMYNIENVQNVFGAFIVNGFSFFHLYQLQALHNWKTQYASYLPLWLQVIGNVESLNSLANVAHNNPGFCYPTINDSKPFVFQHMGHPLIASTKRVCNSWQSNAHNFIVLSGSNMSGKSTFLRTVGVNIILAQAGAPVCATAASIQCAQLVTCMRLNDSLEDNESYFFAEVKRLQQIVETCAVTKCFVILDEILRGTNSDDKQQGTIKTIQKLLQLNATGIVATHDIEVCNWGKQLPSQIQLLCFENSIINNELHFDYTLQHGICQNKSATFLLQKNGVI
jgi:hypothetical protein